MKIKTYAEKFDEAVLGSIELSPSDLSDAMVQAEFLMMLAESDPAVNLCCTVFTQDGKPLYIGGYWPVAPGVTHVFIMAKQNLKFREKLALYEDVRDWIVRVKENTGAHRIQTQCRVNPVHAQFLGKLGFACEGRLTRYTVNGEDVIMWGLTECLVVGARQKVA